MGRPVSLLAFSLLALSWAAGGRVHAQDRTAPGVPRMAAEIPPDGVVQELELADGSRLFGRVEMADGVRVVFRTLSGVRLELARDEIRSLRVQGGPQGREIEPSDPNRTRLFFGPTARALPRGRGYLGVYELLVPFVQVGVTDRITVGGGTPLVFGDGGDSRPFWLTPKVQLLRGERTQAAAGVMHFVFTGHEDPVGIAYGVVTHGTSAASVTAGFGYGYASSERGSWIGMVGGDKRIRHGVKLLAEGYVWREGEGILMGGVRLFGTRLSADLGLVTLLGVDDSVVFPIVNVVWTF